MTDKKNHIDKLFEERLGNRSFEIPSAFLADLESKLPSKKPKSVMWIWFFTFLGLAGLASATYFWYSSNPESTNSNDTISIHFNDTTSTNSKKRKASCMDQTNNKTLDRKLKERKATDLNSNDNKMAFKKAETKNHKVTTSKQSSAVYNSQPNKSVTTSYVSGRKSPEQKKQTSNKQKTISSKKDISSKSNSNVGSNFDETIPTQLSNLNSKTNFGFSPSDTSKNFKNKSRDSAVIRDSIVYRDSLVIRDSVIYTYENSKSKKDKSKFFLEGQAFIGFMRVQPKISSPFESYKTALEAGEKKILSPDFGFTLNAYYNHWTVGSGLKYYQFGEKTNYSTLSISSAIDSIFTTKDTIYLDSMGNIWVPGQGTVPADTFTINIIDTSYTIDSVSTSKSWQNSYSRIVVPLNFGYRFDYKDWSFIPRVGLNFEFSTARQKGIYIDALKEEFIELDQRKFGLSYQLSLELRRSFGKWHVFVNPYYRNNVGYVVNTVDLKRKYGGMGTTFGVGIQF